ncbi:MAG: homoserine dehydrogenase [Candidatus Omnitrophica bacterium]|nr:homoserine dehydrogenase [Candidatus Omnitrophota bacterium]
MKKVNIGLVGLGNIGNAVSEFFLSGVEGRSLVERRTGVDIRLKMVCDNNRERLDGLEGGPDLKKTSSYEDVVDSDDVDIVVELIGGVDPARDLIMRAISGGKHVVTANKALLSGCWEEIFQAADDQKVSIGFEASVGGAIPVIRALKKSFVANRIETIYGILNGTTNFVLTMMAEEGCSFDEALRAAQNKGIAEADPELDISGKDSAHKLAILSVIGYGVDISAENIFTEGISAISAKDLDYAGRWGYCIKLLAIAKHSDRGLELRVHPTLISREHLLSGVREADNALFVRGDLMDDSLLFGKGAGPKPTASSVIGDIVDIAQRTVYCGLGNTPPNGMMKNPEEKPLLPMDELEMSYYLRFSVIDKPGVLSGITSILAENGISIASVSQEERNEGVTVPLIILTHTAREGLLREAVHCIDEQEYTTKKTVVIRREE